MVRFSGVSLVSNDYSLALEWTGTVFLYINAACNPIVYALTNSRYRDAFVRMIRVNKPTDGTRYFFAQDFIGCTQLNPLIVMSYLVCVYSPNNYVLIWHSSNHKIKTKQFRTAFMIFILLNSSTTSIYFSPTSYNAPDWFNVHRRIQILYPVGTSPSDCKTDTQELTCRLPQKKNEHKTGHSTVQSTVCYRMSNEYKPNVERMNRTNNKCLADISNIQRKNNERTEDIYSTIRTYIG